MEPLYTTPTRHSPPPPAWDWDTHHHAEPRARAQIPPPQEQQWTPQPTEDGDVERNPGPPAPVQSHPQDTQWIHEPTQDGDVEPNPGPSPQEPSNEGTVRTLADSFEKRAQEQETQPGISTTHPAQPPPSPTKSPTEDADGHEPDGDEGTNNNGTNEDHSAPDNKAISPAGFTYTPPAQKTDIRAYPFDDNTEKPQEQLPKPAPTENQIIEELVKLNTCDEQPGIMDTEQQTIKIAVINEARSRFHAYLTKHANRTVTTEHIRRQTQDGT